MHGAELARRHATLLGNLPGLAYRCANSPDWPMELVSEGAERLTGYPAERFLRGEISFGEMILPEDQDAVWEAVQEAIDRRGVFRITYRIRHADGDIRYLWEQGQGVFAETGELLALEGFICDVSDAESARQAAERAREQTELALHWMRESEGRYRSILEGASDGILIGDRDLRMIEVNRRAAALLGYEVDELLGRLYPELIHPDDFDATPLRDAELFSRGSLLVERRLRRGDGSYGDFEISSRVLPDGQVLAILRDISDRRAAEDARLNTLRHAMASEHQRSVATLVRGVAHDFNNLLATIVGSGESLLHGGVVASEGLESLERLLLAAERASGLVRQMMRVPGEAVDSIEEVDVEAVFRELEVLFPMPPKLRLSFAVRGALPTLRAEPEGLRRLLSNVIQNAVEAIGDVEGSIAVVATADVMPDAPARRAIRLRVVDSGPGVADGLSLDELCKPFVSTKGTGRGIGLAAVSGIVVAHRGRMELRSPPSGGTELTVWLPAAEAPLPRRMTPTSSGAGGRVLLVDDDESVRASVALLCQALGFEVQQADGGEAGLDALAAAEAAGSLPHAVLVDVHMPGLDGIGFLRRARERFPGLRMILISGQPIPPPAAAEADVRPGFLAKPFGLQRLREVLHGEA